ncbi:hypothetical protein C8A03DRAFT_15034 [Achaetomium macrosporum]|uniref:TFIIIC transcription initiation factor complex subunits Tfc3 n=1 Tax=Achaetomium macrosporum TaxID=79813 RepID=A0AAN7CAS0_9PEZI|nr:hypothetical protein C8A03DRAFT_15034 [Achaetomium macrosporum]
MSGVGLEVLLEGLIPEIAYSGEKGVSISELLKIVRQYHLSVGGRDAPAQDFAAKGLQGSAEDTNSLEKSLSEAELASARWAWDWLRSQPQILINGNKWWNRLELSEALALPEADSVDPAIASVSGEANDSVKSKGKKSKQTLTTRPRICASEDVVWQTLTRHNVDYKRVPALEWACLQGIASAKAEGILQSDLRRLVGQDKRSLPKRTDSLARKGYIAKRTVVVKKMKTSRLWLIDFAPPLVEEETCGLDLSPETLSKDLEPVPWHHRWTGNNIDMDALGRTAVGVLKAFNVMRYADLRQKMGVEGKRWQMKTLAKNCQRLVDLGVLKYTAASFPGSRKVFKDCIKFVREPSAEEWDKFLATGKKTSQYSDATRHREPKPNALALYGKPDDHGRGSGADRSKLKRIFSGWSPEKPLAQTVFEVIRSAGPEGASNPQVSVATVGYQHRRYLSSYLTKVAETQQPPHLQKFQVVSKLVRTGKTSAYMFSAPGATEQTALSHIDEETRAEEEVPAENSSSSISTDPFGFGAVRPQAFAEGQDISLTEMSRIARKYYKTSSKRRLLPRVKAEQIAAAETAHEVATGQDSPTEDQEEQSAESEHNRSLKRRFEATVDEPDKAEGGGGELSAAQEQVPPSTSITGSQVNEESARSISDEDLIMNVLYNGILGKLQLQRSDRNLTWLRSGRGLKKPLIIPIDDGLEEPAIRDLPENQEKSLVLARGVKDGELARTYEFIFGGESYNNAVWIQQEVIKLKSSTDEEPVIVSAAQPASGEIEVASEEITVEAAPTTSGPTRGIKRGRGGGRGRGKKRGQFVSGGAKPYVCPTCGGAWKNDIGLKYHLEKAQVPCNPNFDPVVVLNRSRKRRKLSPAPPPPSSADSEPHNDDQGSKPFVPSTNYNRVSSEAKRRTAQAFDIIAYLLDNNGGVFPGDRALFYAVTKVFLKEFRGQMPPTWKNYQGAVKALETRNMATVHTHMLKTDRGRLQTCSLLVKTGVDPNGIIASMMKQKMRQAHPGIYIPTPFSPTPEELAVLQELDKKPNSKPNANGEKFRSRRKLIEEVEVFNAPYYTQAAPPMEPQKDPLWIWESEREPQSDYSGQKRSADDESSAGPSQKRIKIEIQETPYDDIPVDPSILGDASAEGQPSVLEAIKAYSLLPSRFGGRGRRRSYTLQTFTKFPPELGRMRNPGLASLPKSFFRNATDDPTFQLPIDVIQFLDPNTSLENDAEELEDQGQSQVSSREGSEGVLDEAGVDKSQAGIEMAVEEQQKLTFVCPSVLESISKGSWPDRSVGFFEQHGTSFTLRGWIPSRKSLLAQNLPFRAEEMAEKQTAAKINPRDWIDRNYAKFCSLVNQCAAWEQSQTGTAVMLGGSVAPSYIYINVSPSLSKINNGPVTLKWLEETQYDLETLPYEDLEDDDYGDVNYVEDAERYISREGRSPPKKRRGGKTAGAQPRRTHGGRPPKLKLLPIKTMREHTAYPKSTEDFLRAPNDEDEELDWSSENVRLAAFVVVTTLLGGVDRVVDWGLMMRLMPDQTLSQLRHYWGALRKDRLSTIVSLTEKFRRAFLKAYENNEVPPIDFDNVLAYDWKFLIKWTTKLDMAERRTLPSTREALDESFTVSKFKHGNREWREAFYHPQRSIFNKFQDATSEPLAIAVDGMPDSQPSSEMIVAMSWTRSLCVTPVEAYTADAVLHKRNSLFPSRSKTEITELMIKGVDQLQRQGVISKSSSKWTNGRRWRFNTRVLDSLEKQAQQEKFAKAVQFKRELDEAFKAGEKKKRVTYLTTDGMVMALLNLQAHGRVRIETTGQPNVPMGHEPGNYETRKYTKKYLHFRLDIVPTESYLYNEVTASENSQSSEDNSLAELIARVKAARPPTKGPGGAVPVWCDVFGKVDTERWLKYLSAVLITLASRGSMRAPDVVKTLKPIIMLFEAELIMEWAEGLGLLKAQLEGCAPAVMEWWWIAVEAQREGLMTPAPAEVEVATPAPVTATGGKQRKALPSARPARVTEVIQR